MDDILESMNRGLDKAKEVAAQTGQKLDDMLFSVCDKPGEEKAQSIQELNDSGKALPFLCVRASEPVMVPNCYKMQCDGCGEDVWMSPATKTTFDKVKNKLVVCMVCIAKHLKISREKI